jgi:hypothetical protein
MQTHHHASMANWKISFDYSNAPPLTPNKTPTSGVFPNAVFQTPRDISNGFEPLHSGWTPTFPENSGGFQDTTGRLIDEHSPALRRASASSIHKQPLSSSESLERELASHVHHLSQNPSLHLPPVEPSRRLSSSSTATTLPPLPSQRVEAVTPLKPIIHPEVVSSAQTATPPSTATGARRLAARTTFEDMQSLAQLSHEAPSFTRQRHNVATFPSTTVDMFGYPIAAPATAPVSSQMKQFWDPDTTMSGMNMDFADVGDGFMGGIHKESNYFEWARANDMFQNMPAYIGGHIRASMQETSHSQRPSSIQSNTSAQIPNLNDYSASKDPFATTPVSRGVDPGMLFSLPITSSLELHSAIMAPSPPAFPSVRQPYSHQLRESIREEEERLSRPPSSLANTRLDRATQSSPTKYRPGLGRSLSDNRGKLGQPIRGAGTNNTISRTMSERRSFSGGSTSAGRTSPLKRAHQNRTSLISIPESASTPRPTVKFTIDANGRARAETCYEPTEPKTTPGGPTKSFSDRSSSAAESSSDEEPIIISSRQTSFSYQERPAKTPQLAHFSTSHPSKHSRKTSTSTNGHTSACDQVTAADDHDSEAETVIEEGNQDGDATAALRKVLQTRQKGQMIAGNHAKRQQPLFTQGNAKRGTNQRHVGAQFNRDTISPITISEVPTPSTGGTASTTSGTRCVCGMVENDGEFMIQW